MSIHSREKGEILVSYKIKKAGFRLRGNGIRYCSTFSKYWYSNIILDIAPKELTKEEEAKGLSLDKAVFAIVLLSSG